MPPSSRDIQNATAIVTQLLDRKQFPCGNPIGAKTWGKPASLLTGDPKTTEYWTEHGDTCLNKALKNVHTQAAIETAMEDHKKTQQVLDRLRGEIVNEIRKSDGFVTKHEKFFNAFPKYKATVIEAASAGQTRRCRYCNATIPKGKDYMSTQHADAGCSNKKPATEWVQAAPADTPLSADTLLILTTLRTREGLALTNEPDMAPVTFRCNDHAAMMVTQLYRIGTGPHFEIIRNGDDKSECHYFVVIGRALRKDEDTDNPTQANLIAGTDGTPLGVFGEDAIYMDPWATKHTPEFSRVANDLKGINCDLKKVNKWMVQPHAFKGTLYSACFFD